VFADPTHVSYDAGKSELVFALRDDKKEVMDVVYKGVKPVNFEMATNVVAIGTYKDGRFAADQLLVKCPSKYQAEGEAKAAASGPARSAAQAATPAVPASQSGGR
jgi:cytochrome c-type biogenesis protein CcmE